MSRGRGISYPIAVKVVASAKGDSARPAKSLVETTLELRKEGQELTALRFGLDAHGDLVAGSVNSCSNPCAGRQNDHLGSRLRVSMHRCGRGDLLHQIASDCAPAFVSALLTRMDGQPTRGSPQGCRVRQGTLVDLGQERYRGGNIFDTRAKNWEALV
jgi:hypothetical protein